MNWHFGRFRLDLNEACLWDGDQRQKLRPKTFDLLVYLVEHAGELVTRNELFNALWPDTVVADGVLTTCIGELRKIFGETAQQPKIIATVHRRGYRFIAPVSRPKPLTSLPPSMPPQDTAIQAEPDQATAVSQPWPQFVGRDTELSRLHQWHTSARQGRRQVTIVTGEAGIGKTALVDAFCAQLAADDTYWIARGQCIDHFGAGEAYLPLLEGLGQLGQGRPWGSCHSDALGASPKLAVATARFTRRSGRRAASATSDGDNAGADAERTRRSS